ncbi:hypothetical protein RRG08_033842 [Elysia crispata]|uniref:Uncharacterized protein n=1 Tax=Elysia crispata TaxID=231223 RepID=A0AAE1B989_9GAST|nr:hypothetical protein RRG08_033842 [Elysia crispata]
MPSTKLKVGCRGSGSPRHPLPSHPGSLVYLDYRRAVCPLAARGIPLLNSINKNGVGDPICPIAPVQTAAVTPLPAFLVMPFVCCCTHRSVVNRVNLTSGSSPDYVDICGQGSATLRLSSCQGNSRGDLEGLARDAKTS